MSELARDDLDAARDLLDAEARGQRAFCQLLTMRQERRGRHFALRTRMGEISSYVTSVTLEWVAGKVRLASELPIFIESCEGSERLPADHETRALIQHYRPDWRRQLEMTSYLATRRHHKFPPLLLVGYRPWIHDPRDERWGVFGRAELDSLAVLGLDLSGMYWDIDEHDTRFYAFGGQHRLIAILGLRELIRTGQLHALDREGNPRKEGGLARDELVHRIQTETGENPSDIHARLQELMNEHIGIEVVPAVCEGESYIEALQRLRQLLIDLNKDSASA